MPFDLPKGAISPLSVASWRKALDHRNFQDKELRVIQYGSRALAYYFLQIDPKDDLGKRLTALYKMLSTARKAFRSFTPIAHANKAWDELMALMKDSSNTVAVLGLIQWSTFSVHIFFDNLVFLTHKDVMFINRPNSTWLSTTATSDTMKNWRAFSDIFGFTVAFINYLKARTARNVTVKTTVLPMGNEEAVAKYEKAVEAANNKCKDLAYAALKIFADILTYWPQSKLGARFGIQTKNDGFIGVVGIVAALCSCRAEWVKLK